MQTADRAFDVAHHAGLSQFEFECGARQASFIEGTHHGPGQFRLFKMPRMDIHRDSGNIEPLSAPTADLMQGLAHRPLAHPKDQAGLFCNRDEFVRIQQSIRPLPTHQGLNAGH